MADKSNNQHILIIRIDDRLVHGQVVIGWGTHLQLQTIVVANDEIAANDWEKELMIMGAPGHFRVEVFDLKSSLDFIRQEVNHPGNTMLLLNSIQDLKKLADAGLAPQKINLGGIHYADQRKEYLPYLYLSQEEAALAMALIETGFRLECQDLPTSEQYSLKDILSQ